MLFYSSDDEELIGLCDRVLVMHDGRIAPELAGEQPDQGQPGGGQPGRFPRANDPAGKQALMNTARWQYIHPAPSRICLRCCCWCWPWRSTCIPAQPVCAQTLNSNMRIFLPLIMLAVGQAVVILGGGIDISVGSIVSIVNAILATQVGLQGDPRESCAVMLALVLLVGVASRSGQRLFCRLSCACSRSSPPTPPAFCIAGMALFILPNPGGGIPQRVSRRSTATPPRWASRWRFYDHPGTAGLGGSCADALRALSVRGRRQRPKPPMRPPCRSARCSSAPTSSRA